MANNDAPVAAAASLSTNEGVIANSTLSATDVDGDALTYSIVSNATIGTATITNATTGAYTYTPNLGVSGVDSFTFKVNDGSVDSNIAMVNVSIAPMNIQNEPVGVNAGASSGSLNFLFSMLISLLLGLRRMGLPRIC